MKNHSENKKDVVRIAHIIGKLSAGGVETVVNNYYKNINRTKFQFDYIIDDDSVYEPPQELIDMGARYYVIPRYQNIIVHMKALVKLFRENNYKIVHSNMNTLSVFSLCAAKIAGVQIRINHNHNTAGKGETTRNVMKYMLRPFAKLFATHYCACSKDAGEWLFGKHSMQKGEVAIFNNAIDLKKFSYNEKIRNEVRKELDIEGKFVVGHVGRFCYQKNHEFLIKIFYEVHKKEKNTVLLLVGDGELQEDIKRLVSYLEINNAVKFLGIRKDVERIYQAMDIFVFPSRYEGFGIVGLEAQAAGLPVILSNRVPNELVFTKNVKILDIDGSKWVWVNAIKKFQKFERKDDSYIIRENGFDIAEAAGKLEHYYENCLK